MPYSAKAIANYFLALAKNKGMTLSPMKLQKLVYFAHGWNLAITDEPLIDELVEAWRYGPVIPSLYHEFKSFGSDPITSEATEIEGIRQGGRIKLQIFAPAIDNDPDMARRESTKRLLDKIWDVYGKFTGSQLSTMTHAADSPWALAWEQGQGRKNTDIPDRLIKDHFVTKAQDVQGGR